MLVSGLMRLVAGWRGLLVLGCFWLMVENSSHCLPLVCAGSRLLAAGCWQQQQQMHRILRLRFHAMPRGSRVLLAAHSTVQQGVVAIIVVITRLLIIGSALPLGLQRL